MKAEELKKHNGEGERTYIAYKGKVYDLSDSKMWEKGIHMRLHKAGGDLTSSMEVAPHRDNVLEKFKVIDSLEEETAKLSARERLRLIYRKFHPHPVMIHFPIALFTFSALFNILWLLTSKHSFMLTSFYSYTVAFLGNFLAIPSGFLSWWVNYDKAKTITFSKKITGSVLLFALSVITMLLFSYNGPLYLTSIAIWLSAGLTIYVAYQGGKITFPV